MSTTLARGAAGATPPSQAAVSGSTQAEAEPPFRVHWGCLTRERSAMVDQLFEKSASNCSYSSVPSIAPDIGRNRPRPKHDGTCQGQAQVWPGRGSAPGTCRTTPRCSRKICGAYLRVSGLKEPWREVGVIHSSWSWLDWSAGSIPKTVAIRRAGMGSRPRSRRDSLQIEMLRRLASTAWGTPAACRPCRSQSPTPRLRSGRCGRHGESPERLLRSSM